MYITVCQRRHNLKHRPVVNIGCFSSACRDVNFPFTCGVTCLSEQLFPRAKCPESSSSVSLYNSETSFRLAKKLSFCLELSLSSPQVLNYQSYSQAGNLKDRHCTLLRATAVITSRKTVSQPF